MILDFIELFKRYREFKKSLKDAWCVSMNVSVMDPREVIMQEKTLMRKGFSCTNVSRDDSGNIYKCWLFTDYDRFRIKEIHKHSKNAVGCSSNTVIVDELYWDKRLKKETDNEKIKHE